MVYNIVRGRVEGKIMLRFLLFLSAVLLCAALLGDIIHLDGGGFVEGEIVDEDEDRVVVKTKFGEMSIPRGRIVRIERGTNEEIYKKRLKELKDDDTEGHFELGLWAKRVGLASYAKERFRYVLKLDPDHEFARLELGYRRLKGKWVSEEEYYTAKGFVRYKGEWVEKEVAERLKAGFVRYGDEWVRKEDLPKIKQGYRRLEGKWVPEEEYYKAKGYVKYKGKWMKPEKAERLKKKEEERKKRLELLRFTKQVKGTVKLKCSFKDDAAQWHLERFGELVKRASAILWDMLGGGYYIEEAEIYDKARDGDCVVLNLDRNTVSKPGRGGTVYGYSKGAKFYVGGNCDMDIFIHEFCHAKLGLPDHYGTKIVCIMNASERRKYMRYTFCDRCWESLVKRYPGLKRPGEIGEDFGEPPETKIIITNR